MLKLNSKKEMESIVVLVFHQGDPIPTVDVSCDGARDTKPRRAGDDGTHLAYRLSS
jgi:hypothetical protein